MVERALEKFGAPVYVRHEIVHNRHVVESLKAKGACFVEELDEVPDGAVTIFSAHGVSRAVEDAAGGRRLQVIDATCPLVTKVHLEGRRYARSGREVILIGHAGHPEVVGTMGQIPGTVHLVSTADEVDRLEVSDPDQVAYVTQTTLSIDDAREVVDALKSRFPKIVGPDTKDICYATQNRQRAVHDLAAVVDAILVIGSPNSSNSNRLREIAEQRGVPSYLIEDAAALDWRWLDGVERLGITAGASAPEQLVQELIEALASRSAIEISVLSGQEERMHFRLPPQLTGKQVEPVR
ncbi:MAG TPA: 4-hydroxy-3-methylbut-2-enyl diphosphate reductase [Candidatus Sulfotelmatobacter sp.]|nr:4-hydroxy-3-methylbut-2-enyl diphosphate reductase [Candidatus Sulfotelmatobacter sp.]